MLLDEQGEKCRSQGPARGDQSNRRVWPAILVPERLVRFPEILGGCSRMLGRATDPAVISPPLDPLQSKVLCLAKLFFHLPPEGPFPPHKLKHTQLWQRRYISGSLL